ncbi:hypothetical protein COB64_03620 [Candidatus Wolfebacteria bacterium]|nr:MAG: hypothetical protein COB64_03620 [Candidatus Wolfebacteria bacterium]
MALKRIQHGIFFLVGFALLFFLGSVISQGTAFAFSVSSIKNKITYTYSSNKAVPFLASVAASQSIEIAPEIERAPATFPTQVSRNINNELSLMFVGDIMLDRGVKKSVDKNFDGDISALFKHMVLLQSADILFGNLEGPVSDKGTDLGNKYSFRMDPQALPALKNAGFDILSFANNHVGDWGRTAFEDTLERLKENNLLFAGAGRNSKEAEEPRIITKNGITVGYLAFSDLGPSWIAAKGDTSGILLANNPHFEEIISNAAAQVDALVVSFHWGNEYKPHSSRQTKLSHQAIDAGAKLIIGHHPHIIQDTEEYKNGIIAYSLGNFIFDQHFSQATMEGLLLDITLVKNPFTQEVSIQKTNKFIVRLNEFYQPNEIIEINNSYIDTKAVEGKIVEAQSKPVFCQTPQNINEDLSLFNVNRENSVGDYIPANLISVKGRVSATVTTICLEEDTMEQLQTMFTSAKNDDISLTVTSGFRDKIYQATLYNYWRADNPGSISYPSVASPTHSEHQLGTTVDLTGKSIHYKSTSTIFESSPEYQWLDTNAFKYGFIQSYPKGKEDITGYIYEPWHYRYVGVQNAAAIKQTGLTTTEYLN